MIEVKISYGKKVLTVHVPEKNLLDYAYLPYVPGVVDEEEAITRAIKNPIEMESLEKLSAPGQKVTEPIQGQERYEENLPLGSPDIFQLRSSPHQCEATNLVE